MSEEKENLNFIESIIDEDLKSGKHETILTRFPPEPNGYLHIGHAKSICLNFGVANEYKGMTNLRFDDTNPITEKTEFVNSIKEDIKWLGFEWGPREYFASDYFDQLYAFAVELIRMGKAYVDNSTSEEMADQKGDVNTPGKNSPYRDRPMEENLSLFEEMKDGKISEGEAVLRAKIDMAHPNLNMRDPVIYRIKHTPHHRTGDKWHIYPMYDFAHSLSDAIENITHSLCTLEFENHRPLYDWFIETLAVFPSRQIEFARLNLNSTIMSKRKLKRLVEEGYVDGWDDPRMPTISGLRNRGYTPTSIRNFIDRVGITKRENVIDLSLLEFFIREDLNSNATRRMVVLDPIKVVITTIPEGSKEIMVGENNPEIENSGEREIPFTREIYIERDDFMEDPPKKYFRMAPGRDVRLKHAYILHCEDFSKDAQGNVTEIRCTHYPDSKSGEDTSGIKAKGTLHWVSASEGVPAEVRLYDRLFIDETPDGHADKDFTEFINPDSLEVLNHAICEPAMASDSELFHYQFFRKGYFCKGHDSSTDKLTFNRTVSLKDSWSKAKK